MLETAHAVVEGVLVWPRTSSIIGGMIAATVIMIILSAFERIRKSSKKSLKKVKISLDKMVIIGYILCMRFGKQKNKKS